MDFNGKATKADGGASNGIAVKGDGSKVEQHLLSGLPDHPSLSRESSAPQSRLDDRVPVASALNAIRDEQPRGDFNKLLGANEVDDDQRKDVKGETRISEGEKDIETEKVHAQQSTTTVSSAVQMDENQKVEAIKVEQQESEEEMTEENDLSPPSSIKTTDAIVTHCTAALIGQSSVIDHINMLSSEKQMAKSVLGMGTEIASEKEILDKGGSVSIADNASRARDDDKDSATEKSEKITKIEMDSDKGSNEQITNGKCESGAGSDHLGADKLAEKADHDPKYGQAQKKDEHVEKALSGIPQKLEKEDGNGIKEPKGKTSAKADLDQAGHGEDEISVVTTKKLAEEGLKEIKNEKMTHGNADVVHSGDHREKESDKKGDKKTGTLVEETSKALGSFEISEKKSEPQSSAKIDQRDPCHSANAADITEYVKLGLSEGNIEIQESTIQEASGKSHKDVTSKVDDGLRSIYSKMGEDKDKAAVKDEPLDVSTVVVKDDQVEEKTDKIDPENVRQPSERDETRAKTVKEDENSVKDGQASISKDLPENISEKVDITSEKELKDGAEFERQHETEKQNDGIPEFAKCEKRGKEDEEVAEKDGLDGIPEFAKCEKRQKVDEAVAEKGGLDEKQQEIVVEHVETKAGGKEISEMSSLEQIASEKAEHPKESKKNVQGDSVVEAAEKGGSGSSSTFDPHDVTSGAQKHLVDGDAISENEKGIEDQKANGGVCERGDDVTRAAGASGKTGSDVEAGVIGMQISNEKKASNDIPGKLIAVESDVDLGNDSLEDVINKPAAMPTVPGGSIDSAATAKESAEIKIESVSLTTPFAIEGKAKKNKEEKRQKDENQKSKDKGSRKKSAANKGESDSGDVGEKTDTEIEQEAGLETQNSETESTNDVGVVEEADIEIVANKADVSDETAVGDAERAGVQIEEDAGQLRGTEDVHEMDEKQSPEKIDEESTVSKEKQSDDDGEAIEVVAGKEDDGLAEEINEEKVETVKGNEKNETSEETEKVEDNQKEEMSTDEVENSTGENRDENEQDGPEKAEEIRTGSKNKDGDHDSGVDETTQRKKTPPSAKAAPSPAKKAVSPTTATVTATASPAKTQKTPNSTTKAAPTPTPAAAQAEKKLPMNKIVVGTSPSPNLKVVKSKIGSFENVKHKAGGGQVKVETKKIDLANVKSRIGSTDNITHKPTGGEKKILSRKLEWKAQSKVGSMDNATHKPGGGNKKIEVQKLEFKDKAKPKVGSKDNIQHKPGGGELKIEEHKLSFKDSAQSKVGSLDYVKHQPGGGNIQIFDEKFYNKQQKSSLTNSDEHLSDNRTPSPSAASPNLQQQTDSAPVVNSNNTPLVQDVAHINGGSPLPGVELAGKQ